MGNALSWLSYVAHSGVAWGVYTLLSISAGWLWARRRLLALHRQQQDHQQRVENLLNTSTPGGLADVVSAVRETRSDR